MRILVASDKFKGSLTALEACEAIAAGLKEGATTRNLVIECLPIADGGDGIAETLCGALKGDWIETEVRGPLGDPVTAGYALIEGGKTAVIEMAKASGLVLLEGRAKDPRRASTYGTGQLLAHAKERGVEEILLGIGGSATNDGGTGMAEALGFQFLDEAGNKLVDLPLGLERVARILPPDLTNFPPITVACDVANPLLGREGCTQIYGPQKGITPLAFPEHEARLSRLVAALEDAGSRAAELAGAGAAGGLGFGAIVFLGATLVPGFDLVADHLGLSEAVKRADLVITGEGRLDAQSLKGKAPYGVVQLAQKFGKPTAAFCGIITDPGLVDQFGPISEISDPSLSLAENMAHGGEFLRIAARRFAAETLALIQSSR